VSGSGGELKSDVPPPALPAHLTASLPPYLSVCCTGRAKPKPADKSKSHHCPLCPLPVFPPPLPAGAQLVRINLSEQTDMMDLLGADLPVAGGAPGEFAW
jgi:hypothetical protein